MQNPYIDDLVQERRNYIANALELRLSCTNPSIYDKDLAGTPWWLSYLWYETVMLKCTKSLTEPMLT